MQLSEVVLRPVITEQSVAGLDEKKYTFEVDRRANKTHIKQAVEFYSIICRECLAFVV